MNLLEPANNLFNELDFTSAFGVRFTYLGHFGFSQKYATQKASCQREEAQMDLKELRKLPMPKLRDLAKQETDLKGIGGMEKEALIKAIAEAKGIVYDASTKDVNAIHAVKHDIRALQKQKAELLTSNGDRKKLKRIRRKVKLLKRLTRHLAHETKVAAAAKTEAPAAPAAAAAAPAPPQAGG